MYLVPGPSIFNKLPHNVINLEFSKPAAWRGHVPVERRDGPAPFDQGAPDMAAKSPGSWCGSQLASAGTRAAARPGKKLEQRA